MIRPLLVAAVATVLMTGGAAAQAGDRQIPMLVDAEWLSARLDEPDLVVVQVDQRQDGYDGGHIPGARYLAYGRIAGEVEGLAVELLPVEDLRTAFESVGFNDRARIVLYGAPLSAARAWMTLDYLGVSDRAAMLDGGITAWRTAGHPVSTEAPAAVAPGSPRLTIRLNPDFVVPAEFVLARRADPAYVLIDARPAPEYTGDDNGQNGRYLAGHIPGARHLHWEDLIYSNADPRLRPMEELRTRLAAVGADGQRQVIVYCTIGMRASMAYFVARMLGYDTYFYDGSWADWSAKGMPVEAGPDPRAAGG